MKPQFKGGLVGILVWLVVFVYALIYCFWITCKEIGCLTCVVLKSIPSNPNLLTIVFSTLALFFVVGFLTGWVIGEIKKKREWKREGLRRNESMA